MEMTEKNIKMMGCKCFIFSNKALKLFKNRIINIMMAGCLDILFLSLENIEPTSCITGALNNFYFSNSFNNFSMICSVVTPSASALKLVIMR